MKRNDVVSEKSKGGGFVPFGRIWKRVDADHVVVIFCTKDFETYNINDLEVHDYTGWIDRKKFFLHDEEGHFVYKDDEPILRYETSRFYRMPTLRRLKQMASCYAGRKVWRK